MRLTAALALLSLAACNNPTEVTVRIPEGGHPLHYSFRVASTESYRFHVISPRYASEAALDSLVASLDGVEIVVRSDALDSTYRYEALRDKPHTLHSFGGAFISLAYGLRFRKGDVVTVDATFPNVTAADSVSLEFTRMPNP